MNASRSVSFDATREHGPRSEGRAEPLLRIAGITKAFPGVVANRNVSFEVWPGEVVAVLGENGAGKTTLMNVLYGLDQPDEGALELRGSPFAPRSPRDAIGAGIGMVHQHFMLIPTLTVAENIVVGLRTGRSPRLAMKRAAARIRELSGELGLQVDPDALVGSLSVGEQQRVEILKAVFRGADILILDEPTAVLSGAESENVFAALRRFVNNGRSVLFISHKLEEVLSFSDRIVVLRHGEVVGETAPARASRSKLVSQMVGRDVDLDVRRDERAPGDVVLQVEDVSLSDGRGTTRLRGVSLTLHAGEILAVAGVEGNGQRELADAIAGMLDGVEGRVRLLGEEIHSLSPGDRWDRGLRYVPEDRHGVGLVLDFDVGENAALRRFRQTPITRRGRLSRAAMATVGRDLVKAQDVRVPSPRMAVRNLSGGNQQKIVLGRETDSGLTCLLASQATRGLDAVTARGVLLRMLELRAEDAAVLYLSGDLNEVLSIGDRVAVLYEGMLIGPFERDSVDREALGHMMLRGVPGGERDGTDG